VLWWARHHREPSTPLRSEPVYTDAAKKSGRGWPPAGADPDADDPAAPRLLAAALALRDAAVAHAGVAALYAAARLRGPVAAQLRTMLPVAAAALGAGEGADAGPGARADALLAGLQRHCDSGGEGAGAARAAQLDAARLLLELHHRSSGRRRAAPPEGAGTGAGAGVDTDGLGRELELVACLSPVAEGAAGAAGVACAAASLLDDLPLRSRLAGVLELALSRCPGAALAVVQAYGGPRAAELPGARARALGEEAAAGAEALLSRAAASLCEHARAVGAEEAGAAAGARRDGAALGAAFWARSFGRELHVWDRTLGPSAWALDALRADAAASTTQWLWAPGAKDDFDQKLTARGGAAPASLQCPLETLRRVDAYVAAARALGAHTGAPACRAAEEALAELFANRQGGARQGDAVGAWLADQATSQHAARQPLRGVLCGAPPARAELERATSPAGLRALACLLGPAGCASADARLLAAALTATRAAAEALAACADAAAAVAAEDRGRLRPAAVARLARLAPLDALGTAAARLGALQTLRAQLRAALALALAPALAPGAPTGGAGGAEAAAAAALHAGAPEASWPADGALRAAAEGAEGAGGLLPRGPGDARGVHPGGYALGAVALGGALEAGRCAYLPQPQTLGGGLQGAPRGLVALAQLLGGGAPAGAAACSLQALQAMAEDSRAGRAVGEARVFFLEQLLVEAATALPPALDDVHAGVAGDAGGGGTAAAARGALWSGAAALALPQMLHAARMALEEAAQDPEDPDAGDI
jgi:hypothetical protein